MILKTSALLLTGQLEKALPSEILARYEDRVTEENLNLADLGDLVKYVVSCYSLHTLLHHGHLHKRAEK